MSEEAVLVLNLSPASMCMPPITAKTAEEPAANINRTDITEIAEGKPLITSTSNATHVAA